MTPWNAVKNQSDVDGLLTAAGWFHDACLVEARCTTGAFVDERRWMHFGSPQDRRLLLTFHSQQTGRPFVLRFTGLRRWALTGWPEKIGGELLGCTLTLREGGVLWADSEGFDPWNPRGSYVMAEQLAWRFLNE